MTDPANPDRYHEAHAPQAPTFRPLSLNERIAALEARLADPMAEWRKHVRVCDIPDDDAQPAHPQGDEAAVEALLSAKGPDGQELRAYMSCCAAFSKQDIMGWALAKIRKSEVPGVIAVERAAQPQGDEECDEEDDVIEAITNVCRKLTPVYADDEIGLAILAAIRGGAITLPDDVPQIAALRAKLAEAEDSLLFERKVSAANLTAGREVNAERERLAAQVESLTRERDEAMVRADTRDGEVERARQNAEAAQRDMEIVAERCRTMEKAYSTIGSERDRALADLAAMTAQYEAANDTIKECNATLDRHGVRPGGDGHPSAGINELADRLAAMTERAERAEKFEAVCHCGDLVSLHTDGDGHAPVEMPWECPTERERDALRDELAASKERVEKAEAKITEVMTDFANKVADNCAARAEADALAGLLREAYSCVLAVRQRQSDKEAYNDLIARIDAALAKRGGK